MKTYIKEMTITIVIAELVLYFTNIRWEIIGFIFFAFWVLYQIYKRESNKDSDDGSN